MSDTLAPVVASEPSNATGYRSFRLGKFELSRDEYFVSVRWPAKGARRSHQMPADAFLRACMRDVAWNFFYGWVNFDSVIGTRNHYGKVDFYAGTFNGALKEAGVDYLEQFDSGHIMATFKAILRDWVNEGFDPFAAPVETGTAFGPSRATTSRPSNAPASPPSACRACRAIRRCATTCRSTGPSPTWRRTSPRSTPSRASRAQLHAFSLFKYLSRSDVTWNPSVTAVCKASLACPTTEEFILPVFHGNDRVEWFVQLSDEIVWDVGDKNTGAPRARVTMKAGDVAAMPADIRHQGYSTKRSMLYVWENVTPGLPQRYESGELSPYPVDF